MAGKKIKALVTGGSGFLGATLVQQLVESGKFDVTVLDIRPVEIPGAAMVVGDLTKPEEVEAALAGMDTVFHVATASLQGNNATKRDLMYKVNVTGTENVITACKKLGIGTLVFTSSASVVFDGSHLKGIDETHPYAAKPLDYYTETKIMGEKAVLAANCDALKTVALRPSGIFGEGDPLMVPTLVAKAKEGKSKFMIGDGSNEMDFTYVGNVAQSHLEAYDALCKPDSCVAGQAYFITNQDPLPFWKFTGDILEELGYQRAYIKLPWLLVFCIALLIETLIAPLLSLFGKELKTDFTTFRVTVAACWRHFKCDKAKQDFGYVPKVPMDEAFKRTVKHFEHLRKPAGEKKDD